jgi:DNA mismatch endonuclease (patch repair protein)
MSYKFITTSQRSKNMAAVHSFGNKTTELKFMNILKLHGVIGWRRHLPLPGKPDFTFPKYRVAIFVDGCFWHFCPRCTKIPKKNTKYWIDKKLRNQARDRKISRQLRIRGWHVLRLWEHTLMHSEKVINRISKYIQIL